MQGKPRIPSKNLAQEATRIYRKRNHNQVSVDDFIPPFGGKLSADNRWVKLSRVIPWDQVEERYAARFGKCGNVAIPLRVALGALIIREKCGFTDEETVQNLSENNYMQYFVGYTAFRPGQPFAPSLMVEFRKRIDMAEIQTIIDEVDEENRKDDPPSDGSANRGTLMIDATCAPADVEFGAKVAVSRVDGCFRIETLNWDSFNEGTELIAAIERYRQRYGCYPEAVLADKIYRNRTNLAFCKEHGVRLSGPQLGWPGPSARADRKITHADNAARNGIESPFGIGKRRYGLDRIIAKLRCTAESVIAMQFLLLNLDNRVRFLWRLLLFRLWYGGGRGFAHACRCFRAEVYANGLC